MKPVARVMSAGLCGMVVVIAAEATRGDDELDRAIAELEAHAKRVVAVVQELARRLDQIEQDPELKQSRDRSLRIFYPFVEQRGRSAQPYVERLQETREQYATRCGDSPANAEFEPRYQRFRRGERNAALEVCITNYCWISEDLLKVFAGEYVDDPGFHILFWADVLNMDPAALAEEQRLKWGGNTSFQIIREDRTRFYDLCHAPRIQFQADLHAAKIECQRGYDSCPRFPSPAEQQRACRARVSALYCAAMRRIYDQWVDATKERYDRAANRFPVVFRSTMGWGEREVLDAREYAARSFKCMRFAKDDPAHVPMPDGSRITESENRLRNVNQAYANLVQTLVDADRSYWALAKYLKSESQWFAVKRAEKEQLFAHEKKNIESGDNYSSPHCEEAPLKHLEFLAEAAWKEYLQTLPDRMKSDFQAKHEDCDPQLIYDYLRKEEVAHELFDHALDLLHERNKEEREFLREKFPEILAKALEHGSVDVMLEAAREHWWDIFSTPIKSQDDLDAWLRAQPSVEAAAGWEQTLIRVATLYAIADLAKEAYEIYDMSRRHDAIGREAERAFDQGRAIWQSALADFKASLAQEEACAEERARARAREELEDKVRELLDEWDLGTGRYRDASGQVYDAGGAARRAREILSGHSSLNRNRIPGVSAQLVSLVQDSPATGINVTVTKQQFQSAITEIERARRLFEEGINGLIRETISEEKCLRRLQELLKSGRSNGRLRAAQAKTGVEQELLGASAGNDFNELIATAGRRPTDYLLALTESNGRFKAAELADDREAPDSILDRLHTRIRQYDREYSFVGDMRNGPPSADFRSLVVSESPYPAGYLLAARQSFSRFRGAQNVADREWMTKHLVAAREFAHLASAGLEARATADRKTATRLKGTAFAVRRTHEEAAALLEKLRTHGLDVEHRQLLQLGRFTPDEIAEFEKQLLNTPVDVLASSIVELYDKVAEARHALAAKTIALCEDFHEDPSGDPAPPTPVPRPWISAGLALLLGAVVLLVFFWRRRRAHARRN